MARAIHAQREDAAPVPLPPGLYLVATPIGNAADITLRALDALARAQVIAAEDTRRTRQLLDLHGVALGGRKLIPYHDHNGARARPGLLKLIREGASVALVSDAGTPLIADPGYRLAAEAEAEGLAVTALPGASAALTALSLSGLPSDRFLFAGFLPSKAGERRRELATLAAIPATLILYESPHRIAKSLADMAELLGPRDAALCRELTKRFEEVRRAPLPELAAQLAAEPAPKGEIALVIGPPAPSDTGPQALDAALKDALQGASVKTAAADVAAALGLPRREVYARALELAGRA